MCLFGYENTNHSYWNHSWVYTLLCNEPLGISSEETGVGRCVAYSAHWYGCIHMAPGDTTCNFSPCHDFHDGLKIVKETTDGVEKSALDAQKLSHPGGIQ
jgi:hypothetical protein